MLGGQGKFDAGPTLLSAKCYVPIAIVATRLPRKSPTFFGVFAMGAIRTPPFVIQRNRVWAAANRPVRSRIRDKLRAWQRPCPASIELPDELQIAGQHAIDRLLNQRLIFGQAIGDRRLNGQGFGNVFHCRIHQ